MSWAALIYGERFVTWPAVFAALGALAAALWLTALRLYRGRRLACLWLFTGTAVLFSLAVGRLMHWYSHPLQYDSFRQAMTSLEPGDFSLSGAFLGTLLAALLFRALGSYRSLWEFLDALAPSAALGIAVGRLGSAFDLSDRGWFALQTEALHRLPFSVWTASGAGGEWRFATFAVQAAWAAVVWLICTGLYLGRSGGRKKYLRGTGHVLCLFLALYGASQVVLDSTRYDADFLRSNGFIHVPQLLGMAAVIAALVRYSANSIARRGLKWWHFGAWVLFLGLGGGAGYMEYYVQRYSTRYPFAYGVMSACLAGMLLVILALALSSGGEREEKPASRETEDGSADKQPAGKPSPEQTGRSAAAGLLSAALLLSGTAPAEIQTTPLRYGGAMAVIEEYFEQHADLPEDRALLRDCIGIGYKNLVTGEEAYLNPDLHLHGGSIYKVSLNMIWAKRVNDGLASWDDYVSGVPLNRLQANSLLYSSNDAARCLYDALGDYKQARLMCAPLYGMTEEEALADRLYYVATLTSARENIHCLTELYEHSSEYPGVISCMLRATPDRYFRLNGSDWPIAQKFGYIYTPWTYMSTMGIVYTPEPFALVILSEKMWYMEEHIAGICQALAEYTAGHSGAAAS